MNEKQNWEFAHIVQQCEDGQYRSINVASKIRSDAIVAAWCELNSLRINLAAAVEACKHALFELEHAHSVADDWYPSADGATQEALNDMIPAEDDHSTTSKLRTAISKAEGKQ